MHAAQPDLSVREGAVHVHLHRLGPQRSRDVLLVPGLGASPRAFGARPGRSLVSDLADAGLTPWAVDFQVSWRARSQGADALLEGLAEGVAALSRRPDAPGASLAAVGHSLGGMLLLALAAGGSAFSHLVTLGAGLDFRLGRSPLPRLLSLAPRGLPVMRLRVDRGGLPLRRLARIGAPLFGRGARLPVERDQFHPGTTHGTVVRTVVRDGVRDLPLPLLLDLSALFTARGLELGVMSVPLKDAIRSIAVPTLVVGGVQDRQCPIGAVRDMASRIPGARLLEVGRSSMPGEGYGHVDLMTATRAPEDVFDPVLDFLLGDGA